MTRFQQEISGQLGDFWKKHAERELESIKEDLKNGAVTIDEDGVARNRIGRVVMSDLLEKILYITDEVNEVATAAARSEEVSKSIAEYRESSHQFSEEDVFEMKAAFGAGTKIVDVLSGTTIQL